MAELKQKLNVLTAFTGGEVSPKLAGRVDKDEVRIGSRYLSNFMPQVQGGLKKFYGSTKILSVDHVGDLGPYKLVPFSGADEPLSLLFIDDKVFVITSEEAYPLSFGVPSFQIDGCSFLQINDVIKFTSESGGMFELRYHGRVNGKHFFGYYTSAFYDVPYFPIGWQGNYYGTITTEGSPEGIITIKSATPGAIYGVALPVTLQNSGSGKNIIDEATQYTLLTAGDSTEGGPLAVSVGQSVISLVRVRSGAQTTILSANIGNENQVSSRSITGGAGKIGGTSRMPTISYTSQTAETRYGYQKLVSSTQIINAFPELGVTALSADLSSLLFTVLPEGHQDGDAYFIRFTQNASTCSNPSASVTRFDSNFIRKASIPAYTDEGEQAALIQGSETYDALDVVGRKIKFYMQQTQDVVLSWVEGTSYGQGTIVFSDGNYYRAVTGGTSGSTQPTHVYGTVSDGALLWRYLHSGSGTATIISVEDATTMRAKVDNCLPVLTWGAGPYQWDNFQWSMWGYNGRYPNKVFFYRGRIGYTFNSGEYGSYLQMSKTESYDDFGTDDYGVVLDTSGINVQISGHQDNRVNWVLPGYKLYFGSYSGEYVAAGGQSGAISPTTLSLLPVSNSGGANVDALKFEDLYMFVGVSGREVYSLRYDLYSDDYTPSNIGFTSDELLKDGVTRLEYLRNIDRNVYFTTETNELRFINYAKEAGMLGFYRANLNADVLDIATSNAGANSRMFVFLRRNGNYMVERIDSYSPTYMLSRRIYDYTSLVRDYEVESTDTTNLLRFEDAQTSPYTWDFLGKFNISVNNEEMSAVLTFEGKTANESESASLRGEGRINDATGQIEFILSGTVAGYNIYAGTTEEDTWKATVAINYEEDTLTLVSITYPIPETVVRYKLSVVNPTDATHVAGTGDPVPTTIYEPELAGFKVYVQNGESGSFYSQEVGWDGAIEVYPDTRLAYVGIAMLCEAHLTPAMDEKAEGQQQKALRFLVRLLESGSFSYGSSVDFEKWYDYNKWSVVDGQQWGDEHQYITGDFLLPASFGYTKGNNASGLYPNSTAIALNIKSDTPEPLNLLMVTNMYV